MHISYITFRQTHFEHFNSFQCIKTLYVLNFQREQNTYLHFMKFLHADITQVVEILPQIRQEPTYFT